MPLATWEEAKGGTEYLFEASGFASISLAVSRFVLPSVAAAEHKSTLAEVKKIMINV